MNLKFYKRTKTKFSKFNLLFSQPNFVINSTTSPLESPILLANLPASFTNLFTQKFNLKQQLKLKKNQKIVKPLKKKGKEYNGGVDVDEESPMLEEVIAPSKYIFFRF